MTSPITECRERGYRARQAWRTPVMETGVGRTGVRFGAPFHAPDHDRRGPVATTPAGPLVTRYRVTG